MGCLAGRGEEIQADLAGRVDLNDAISLDAIEIVAGVDNTYITRDGKTTAGAVVVVLTFPAMEIVETAVAWQPIAFPYVPGLLSFREAPRCCRLLRSQRRAGRVPLRRSGLCPSPPAWAGVHLGLFLERPTIGCARAGSSASTKTGARLRRRHAARRSGRSRRRRGPRPRHKPLFVSPGHKISVETAVAIALACCRDGAFLPEPTVGARDRDARAARGSNHMGR